MPPDAASRQCPGAFLNSGFFVRVLFFAVAVAGCTVAAAALALPAALLGDPHNGQCKQNDQNDQRNDSTKCQHFLYLFSRWESFCVQYTRFGIKGQPESGYKKCDFFKIRACILAKAVL
ncbi:hypothetical protein HMPREF9436_01789 [Faecalibacterium cf. prausnitzii KLE1255]|uniref:Uncharacterized protein n=1 Tax=Faecalibacterium cf. prausnitzii KLE1255 TaxID=748224 RepID=E2ZJE1_9FIRM|nr:hypothetical protein HMPREF9436_01789 [Faecalibacterium cf. prausnitzii KLE1255]DAK54114.1 MAG TPA: hypothetical protein [Caudoviricetes sp.]